MSTPLQKLYFTLIIFLVGGFFYLLAWPVPIDPEAWTPQAVVPAQIRWPEASWTAPVQVIPTRRGHGPEDIAVDDQGRVYVGVSNGEILRFSPQREWEVEAIVNTGGRPLGLQFDDQGRLLIADAVRGLLRLEGEALNVLTTTCAGRPLGFTDDVDVAADGTIWFSDASERFTFHDWKLDIMESRPNGRLCRHDPNTGETDEILGKLYFANGVAVDPGQRFVLVNETSRYRVRRYWLNGPKKGTHDLLIDNLQSFPDGISAGENGLFWIAFAAPRNPLLDYLAPSPFLRKLIVRLPQALQPDPSYTTELLGVDASGEVRTHFLQTKSPDLPMVTSVQQRGSHLYLGSLDSPSWARIPAP